MWRSTEEREGENPGESTDKSTEYLIDESPKVAERQPQVDEELNVGERRKTEGRKKGQSRRSIQ